MMASGFPLTPLVAIAAVVVLSWAAVVAPAPARKGFDVTTLSFDEGYAPLFGDGNLVRSPDGRSVRLHLNQYSGSGFISSDLYQHGLFSASIKLPSDYTAGIVVAFYTSNGDMFEKTHDELDLEFLGNIKGREWRLQTNVYGNGSTSRGREERYLLPFDPTAQAHRYSILWTSDTIIFYVDETPIREVKRSEAMGDDFPSKPMKLYATIWDGSGWATSGGKYKVNYKYSPFISEFSDLVLQGCRMDPIQLLPLDEQCADAEAELTAADYASMSPEKRQAMRKYREKYMTYSFCYDTLRYPTTFPDCDIVPSEQRRFRENGDSKIILRHRRPKHRNNNKFSNAAVDSERQSDI